MIQVNKEYLKNEGYTSTIIEKAKRELSRKRARYNRYTRSQYKSTIDIAMEYYIVNIASGYFWWNSTRDSSKARNKQEEHISIKETI